MPDTEKDYLLSIRVSQDPRPDPHACENAEILYLIRGQMRIILGTQISQIQEGDFLLIPAGQQCAISAEGEALYLMIQINGRTVRRYIDPNRLSCTLQMSREENPGNLKIRSLIGRMLSLGLSEAPEDRLLYDSVCGEFLYHFYKSYCLPSSPEENEETIRKRQIEAYIAQNYTYPIRLADLAEYMHFSNVYLSRYFKKLFGANFLEYLTAYRLAAAKEDLAAKSRRSITQSAYDNGFSNLNSFYTVLKNDCGLTPAEYRAQKEDEAAKQRADEQKAKASLCAWLQTGQSDDAPEEERLSDEIICSAAQKGERYTRVWSQVINIGEVRNLLRSDFQKHILMLHKDLGFSHIRCWNLYADEFKMGIRRSREDQTDAYDFTILDRALDFLVENGIGLYLDLGIKPYRLLNGQLRFVYGEQKRTVFETFEEHSRFIRRFIRHYRRRYGADEIARWYFEYWFDYEAPAPDAAEIYEREFRMLRDIIKAEVPGAKVGGIGDDPGVLSGMQDVLSCADFLSCYSYPDDEVGKDDPSGNRIMPREDYLERQAARLKALRPRTNNAQIHISEWSLSVSSRNMMNDSVFKAAYIVRNCIHAMDDVDILAYWNGTDLYEEYTDTNQILFGGTGLLTRQSICKPAWYAFQMLNKLGKYRIGRSENAIVTKNSGTDIYILCHNEKKLNLDYYSRPEETLRAQDYESFFEDREQRLLTIRLDDLPCGNYQISTRIINEDYGNAQKICEESNGRKDLTINDIRYLRQRCMPHTIYEHYDVKEDNRMRLQIQLEPDEVRLIHIRRA